uniref:Uncharacterized protein n=1 Tax=Acrobeloides nanus TaxID=290746 RepID=A0A914CWM7_9BILA
MASNCWQRKWNNATNLQPVPCYGPNMFGCAIFKIRNTTEIIRSCATTKFCKIPGCRFNIDAHGVPFDWICCCVENMCNYEISLGHYEFWDYEGIGAESVS